ncbi:hypothetical protein GPECTOR_53g154 [Gonium pectorale]|uniref:Uncharacterized protein n=1 Tax=Gonium pectorale TaxID=33097 RepID=A0A150G6V9_GONPE|nr:hypothetical protein GPECTOR_53g154 [Gonium pectorale]|eukprot:KXZ45568.1 hypothetical protein GPECTOR_53g154 [Gonium pectorale]
MSEFEAGTERGLRAPIPPPRSLRAAQNGWTPLHFAASYGHVEALQALLDARATVDVANKNGSTPLNIAAQNGHVEALQALLRADADKEAADKDGWTPLHVVVEAVRAMLRKGYKGVDDKGAGKKHVEAVRALLIKGANKDAAEKNPVPMRNHSTTYSTAIESSSDPRAGLRPLGLSGVRSEPYVYVVSCFI